MSKSEALTPEIFNVTITSADTEYSQALSKGTKHFSVQCRTAADVRFAFESGKVATPTAPYATIKSGQSYTCPEKMGYSGTLYFGAASGSLVVEIVAWKDIRS